MKNWAFFLFTVVAVGAATVVVSVALQTRRRGHELNEIPEIIEDCFSRIRQIERDLRQLQPAPEGAA
jgi:hypothetical protein